MKSLDVLISGTIIFYLMKMLTLVVYNNKPINKVTTILNTEKIGNFGGRTQIAMCHV
jgi:hypothetical protein